LEMSSELEMGQNENRHPIIQVAQEREERSKKTNLSNNDARKKGWKMKVVTGEKKYPNLREQTSIV